MCVNIPGMRICDMALGRYHISLLNGTDSKHSVLRIESVDVRCGPRAMCTPDWRHLPSTIANATLSF